jgi:UDP-N-acetyl-D-glucosamine dehydrogenase
MSQDYNSLLKLIEKKKARIGIIGLGYVGLPIVLRFCEEGFNVVGFDVDSEKVRCLKRGKSYIKYISNERISQLVGHNPAVFTATTDMSLLSGVEVILICVPTPLTNNREPNLTYIESTAREIARFLRPGQLIVLESTTYPGTTEEFLPAVF